MSTKDAPASRADSDPLGVAVETRPALDDALTEAEFRRWYWLRDELAAFARARGVSASGSKIALTERLADSLADRTTARPPRRAATQQLAGPLTADTVIPAGQRASQHLRTWFLGQIGPSFLFDAAMREYLAAGGGTLGDAVAFWHASRSNEPRSIAPQFELNRFTRAWYAEHPDGHRTDLLAAWRQYRALPADQRARA
ncbi:MULTISPECIES: DUF6434 domain-containing protein [unclassified Rathayibacter]|uniref:DUF6434 domain-containing protein n=1 Tax=unclassified Rathayibacter TaxID=2609250 RepID=UPI0010F1E0BB|nr:MULTISPECIES: DUF6434 domain-containing protein [unclassified Rathayibacter]TCL79557.1 hypothetical protein EDF49_111193 [Rathayibacter sp. PhB192]TCM25174.1 hypothetical protein EDF43_1112 [Rathayibacter sp. PhB179]